MKLLYTEKLVVPGRKRKGFSLILQILENASCAHSAAHTHRDQTVFRLAPLHLLQDRRRQLGTRAAQRMTQRYCSTIDIDLRWIELRLFNHRKRLRGKRLIQFDQ